MNRLGIEGRGESVWLGFFLIDVLRRFAVVAGLRGDAVLERRCRDEAMMLAQRIEEHAWDGSWYLRAWADDGTAVGSRDSEECRIDSLPQSWAAITGAGSAARREQALDAALEKLWRRQVRLVQLFDPPFDKCALDPGYIKGYVPGIRENGGQYTHAAIWLGMACAAAGRAEAAWALFEDLNPLNHARDETGVETYQLEPYVVAADVYWAAAHRGSGGWSWYTGSAGWMLRYALESILGLCIVDGRLRLAPCLPPHWPGYRMRYRHGDSVYAIEVRRAEADESAGLSLDGNAADERGVALVDDGRLHRVLCLLAA
jgi:cellobiose phosphorylase